MGDDLKPGLYEKLITRQLDEALHQVDVARIAVERGELDPADAHVALARHIQQILLRVLRALPEERRLEQQLLICNSLIERLRELVPPAALPEPGELVAAPGSELRSVYLLEGLVADDRAHIPRPPVPLSASDLLVNARGEPGVGHALMREIPSADSIDILCAFVRWNGLRLLEPQLRVHCERGRPLRVLTTTYIGATERRALDLLVSMGAQVRVSYETRSTRLHAKAWLFNRDTGFSTAYVGSSNLSHSALLDGLEWNVRLSQVSAPDVVEKFRATFEGYWEDAEFEPYDPSRDADRFDRAVASEGTTEALPFLSLDVVPFLHQEQILERLRVERERHHRFRSLVVAATGTGKTIVAALDYRRLREEMGNPSLLFVAHRKELLAQSLTAFRVVLRDGAFGELFVDGHRPDEWKHVFASVQSLSHVDLARVAPDAFDVVIVDEFHHAAADTYRRLLDHLRPKILLGLTATPERADGQSVLEWFDGRIAVELRLWEALERNLLCPFHYFGLHDTVDLSGVTWTRGAYDIGQLDNLYTGHHARVWLVIQELRNKVVDVTRMRALGFCVSIRHAEFMAAQFEKHGIRARAVSAETPRQEREQALRLLRDREVNVLFSVDLFNEGVDVPEIDTVLFLRPTESATVFLQQLGRGLRHASGKDCLTVLDFIGRANRNFRFDQRFRAITGGTRASIARDVEEGFPRLPAGCVIRLDRVSSDIVLDNIRSAVGTTMRSLVRELQALSPTATLAQFIAAAGVEIDDLYRSHGWCWTRLRRQAGFERSTAGPYEDRLARGVRRLLHMDDARRIRELGTALETSLGAGAADVLSVYERRLLAGSLLSLWGANDLPGGLPQLLEQTSQHAPVREELLQLLPLLEERAGHMSFPIADEMQRGAPLRLVGGPAVLDHGLESCWGDVPLSVHSRYSLDEIVAAFGRTTVEKPYRVREGVMVDESTRSDVFFVTLEKSERHYSPTTMYKDYAISPALFHWESQAGTTERSETGQRYIHHRARGTHVLLFVRRSRTEAGRTAAYTFLGPADYVSHRGERPMAIVWRLRRPMPADFFREARVAAG